MWNKKFLCISNYSKNFKAVHESNTQKHSPQRNLKSCVDALRLSSFTKKGVFGIKQKSEHHHWILDVRISLRTKFQLKLEILIFWTKFAQKGCF